MSLPSRSSSSLQVYGRINSSATLRSPLAPPPRAACRPAFLDRQGAWRGSTNRVSDGLCLPSDVGTLGRVRPHPIHPAGAASRVWGEGEESERDSGWAPRGGKREANERRRRVERAGGSHALKRLAFEKPGVLSVAGGPASCQVSRYCRACYCHGAQNL